MHSPYLRHLRGIADGVGHPSAMDQRRISAAFCFQPLYTQPFNGSCIHTSSRYSHSSYLSRMSLQTQLVGYPLLSKCTRSGCFSWLYFISVIFQSHLGAFWLPSCMKILLTVHTRPTAITLNYSVKTYGTIIIIFDEKSRFNSLVLRECERAPITLGLVEVS